MRVYLSSYGFGHRSDLFASMVPTGANGFVIMNAVDGGDVGRRKAALARQIDGLASLGLSADNLDLRDLTADSLDRDLAAAAFFWVHGGNVFTLRMAMLESGLDKYIVEGLHADRFAYGGFSAGGCVLAPSLSGLELCDPRHDCEAIYGRTLDHGLGVLDRPFVPHLESTDHHEAEVMASVAQHYRAIGCDFWGLRDGEALVLNGDRPVVL